MNTNAKLEAVDNGYIVSWDEMGKASQGGMYSPMSYNRKQEVYGKDQHAEAMACLNKHSGAEDAGESESPKEEMKEHNRPIGERQDSMKEEY